MTAGLVGDEQDSGMTRAVGTEVVAWGGWDTRFLAHGNGGCHFLPAAFAVACSTPASSGATLPRGPAFGPWPMPQSTTRSYRAAYAAVLVVRETSRPVRMRTSDASQTLARMSPRRRGLSTPPLWGGISVHIICTHIMGVKR